MSKYIRTTQGIFEYKDNMSIENAVYYCFGKFEKTDKKHLFRKKQDCGAVVKQADTIEELCDEIIIRHLTSSKPHIADDFQKEQLLKDRQRAFTECGVEEVKFAIWIGMDLIYVAKMNDKGELELI